MFLLANVCIVITNAVKLTTNFVKFWDIATWSIQKYLLLLRIIKVRNLSLDKFCFKHSSAYLRSFLTDFFSFVIILVSTASCYFILAVPMRKISCVAMHEIPVPCNPYIQEGPFNFRSNWHFWLKLCYQSTDCVDNESKYNINEINRYTRLASHGTSYWWLM